MANIYTVINQFDTAITNAGYTVNNSDIAQCQSIEQGVEVWTYIPADGIEIQETDQISNHVVYEVDYRIKICRGDLTGQGTPEVRNSEIADDFNSIMTALYQAVGSSDADLLKFESGDMSFLTENNYQSYADQLYRFKFRQQVC